MSNKIGRNELQAFIGAMEHVQKRRVYHYLEVYKRSCCFIESNSKNVKLIDGDLLSDLLVKYEVGGCFCAEKISIYKIDAEYFNI